VKLHHIEEVPSLPFLGGPVHIIAVIVIAEDGIDPERGAEHGKRTEMIVHLAGHFVHEIAGEEDQIGALFQDLHNPFPYGMLIEETPDVEIRNVDDLEAIEGRRQTGKSDLDLVQFEIVSTGYA
jgi:hypothetical protein